MPDKLNVTYNKDSQPFILDAFHLKAGDGGELVDKTSGKPIKDVNNETLKSKDFGGIGKASKHFVKKDAFSLIKLNKKITK